jgi:hypothetical protein
LKGCGARVRLLPSYLILSEIYFASRFLEEIRGRAREELKRLVLSIPGVDVLSTRHSYLTCNPHVFFHLERRYVPKIETIIRFSRYLYVHTPQTGSQVMESHRQGCPSNSFSGVE